MAKAKKKKKAAKKKKAKPAEAPGDDPPGRGAAPDPRETYREAFRVSFRGKVFKTLLGLRTLTPSAMAEYARRNTLFYDIFYDGKDTSKFESLPVVQKHHVKDISPYDLLSRPYRKKVAYYGESTGSSGSPTPTFLTRTEFKAASMMARMSPYASALRTIFKKNRTCLNGLAMSFTIAGLSFGDLLQDLGGLVANVSSRSTLGTPERIARAIVRLRPAIIAATPVDFLSWMRIVEEDYPRQAEEVKEDIKALVSTAELCARSRSARIEEAFGIVHVNTYACVEGFFTIPCPCGEMHVPDIYRAELFDAKLRKSATLGRGRLCFTNLAKKSSPLVRYLLDDTVTVYRSECPYGFPKSIVPHGRAEMGVDIGGTIYNVEDFESVLFRHGLFGAYEVRVSGSSLAVKCERYGPQRISKADLAADLKKTFGMRANVRLVKFGSMTRYREVRQTKPILRLFDARKSSTQKLPETL
jgi:phenylacetate-CoA ligase